MFMDVQVVILNIPYNYRKTGEEYIIPEWILDNLKIRVNTCIDVGPATKTMGGLNYLPPHSLIVYIDDDVIYKDFTIDGLRNFIDKNKTGISCWII